MEEEAKAEVKAEETMDIGTMVEEALEQKPEAEVTEDDGRQAGEGQKDSKGEGWLTMLPKELRDGVDASKYSSLAEYIKDLRDHRQAEEDDATKEQMESEWETLISDADGSESTDEEKALNKELIEGLRKDGVKAKDVRKTLSAYASATKRLEESKAKKAEEDLKAFIDGSWGQNAKANFEDAKRGLKVIAGENREILQRAQKEGVTNSPAFIEVCRMLGARTKESAVLPTSGGSPQKGKVDPMNPFGF